MNRHEFQQVAKQFRAGKISLAELTDRVFPAATGESSTVAELPNLPARQPDSHKRHFGHVLVVAGAEGMAGAAALTGLAALRSGAGLVTIATAARCLATVAAVAPELMTVPLAEDNAGRITVPAWDTIGELCGVPDCLAFGPGLGQSPALQRLARDIFENAPCPAVIDADGLNNLGRDFIWPAAAESRVLTPHPGELRRLVELADGDSREQLETRAVELAGRMELAGGQSKDKPHRSRCVVLLKGHRTFITDGSQSRHNQTGNAGMATAGSGDVLTGVIAALIGQGLNTWDATVLGCHLHGAAGDRAAAKKGLHGLIATDIIEFLPESFQCHSGLSTSST